MRQLGLTSKIQLVLFPSLTGAAMAQSGTSRRGENTTIIPTLFYYYVHKGERRGGQSSQRKKMNPLFYSPRHMIIIRTQSRWARSKVVGEDPQVTIRTDREPRALGLPIPNGNPFQQTSLNLHDLYCGTNCRRTEEGKETAGRFIKAPSESSPLKAIPVSGRDLPR